MTAPHVLVLYNHPVLPVDHPDADSEHSVVQIAEKIAGVLEHEGFRTSIFGLDHDPTVLWREIDIRKPDVVFNLYEGTLDDTESESYVAGLLQWKGIPFTGSPMAALSLCRAKHTTKRLLRGAGLPTSDFFIVEEMPLPACTLEWPVIVKPARQDASVGLDQASVCTTPSQLESRVRYILETYGAPVLVEEFIAGREFNVALFELPDLVYMSPSEIMFPSDRPGFWPILTYAGKWKHESDEYLSTPPKFPADIPPQLAESLGTLAMQAYRLVGCRDYARVDFRVRSDGRPYILEVNPNPEISEDAGFAGCLGSAKISYNDFLVRLATHAMHRPAVAFSLPTRGAPYQPVS